MTRVGSRCCCCDCDYDFYCFAPCKVLFVVVWHCNSSSNNNNNNKISVHKLKIVWFAGNRITASLIQALPFRFIVCRLLFVVRRSWCYCIRHNNNNNNNISIVNNMELPVLDLLSYLLHCLSVKLLGVLNIVQETYPVVCNWYLMIYLNWTTTTTTTSTTDIMKMVVVFRRGCCSITTTIIKVGYW